MPYTSCPGCQLSVYAPRAAFSTLHHCPNCDAVLSQAPKLLAGEPPPRLVERVGGARAAGGFRATSQPLPGG